MSVDLPIVFNRPHDEVWFWSVDTLELQYFPSDWTDTEIEDWLFRDRDRKGRRILRREIKIDKRDPYTQEL